MINYIMLFLNGYMISAYSNRLKQGAKYPKIDMTFLIMHCAMLIFTITVILKG